MLDGETRQSLRDVRRGLQWILGVLSGDGVTPEDRVLAAQSFASRPSARKSAGPSKSRAAKKKMRKR